MYTLRVKGHFDAAHQLMDYQGKCSRIHGHRWNVEVTLRGDTLYGGNMLVDFGEVKRYLNEILDSTFDHYNLNEMLAEDNPTAEFIAKRLYNLLATYWSILVSVTVWESPDCSVTFTAKGKE